MMKRYHYMNDIFSLGALAYNLYSLSQNFKLMANNNSLFSYRSNAEKLHQLNFMGLPATLQGEKKLRKRFYRK